MRLRKIGKYLFILCLIAFLISSVIIYSKTADNIINKTCSSEITAKINDIINESNDKIMSLNFFYDDYFSIYYDNNKNVSSVVANTGLINQITLLWNTEIQNRLNKLRNEKITINTGVMTGSAILSKYGTPIELTPEVISNCVITFDSKLIHSGINHTLHRLILLTEITADIIVPKNTEQVKVTQEVVLAETLIPGNVPESYLIGDNSVDYLDLLP